MAENRQPKRYPQNLGGVLQLAVDAGSAAEGPSPIEPMSEEVKASYYIMFVLTIYLNLEKGLNRNPYTPTPC